MARTHTPPRPRRSTHAANKPRPVPRAPAAEALAESLGKQLRPRRRAGAPLLGWLRAPQIHVEPVDERRANEQLGRKTRLERRRGAVITNKVKGPRYRARNAQIEQCYAALVAAGLEELRSEREAKANAVKTIVGKENIKAQRVRDILRQQAKIERSSASR